MTDTIFGIFFTNDKCIKLTVLIDYDNLLVSVINIFRLFTCIDVSWKVLMIVYLYRIDLTMI